MKRIISAVVVFAIVGGALAFKSDDNFAYKCTNANPIDNQFRCEFDNDGSTVFSSGEIIIPVGITGPSTLLHQRCDDGTVGTGTTKPCNLANVRYSSEN